MAAHATRRGPVAYVRCRDAEGQLQCRLITTVPAACMAAVLEPDTNTLWTARVALAAKQEAK